MAHFAKIEDGIVRQVVVINNEVLLEDGVEKESIGAAFCQSLYGDDTQWVQTSYNGNFRGTYAASGMTYDAVKDEFGYPQPAEEIAALG